MIRMEHELPLTLIDNRPDLVVRLARARGLDVPEGVTAEMVSSDLTRITPVTERRADRAVLLRGPHGETEGVVVVEVQRSAEAEARMRWPGKVATAYEKHGCDTYLVVICPDPTVATWAARPVVIGEPEGPGMVLRMVVVPPEGIPVVTDVDQARAEPELGSVS